MLDGHRVRARGHVETAGIAPCVPAARLTPGPVTRQNSAGRASYSPSEAFEANISLGLFDIWHGGLLRWSERARQADRATALFSSPPVCVQLVRDLRLVPLLPLAGAPCS
ncbi:hypothetical protein AAFF_G00012640 [Aldrovandia affinis]|uniref:Uncharacterized protein n=1 Tax=Aldrovandia affinis TaxID=143900 RepID=A0AAD7WH67_9TELE|nr:hypothetical protein AAFF_G00012640 [Aldrovandia affinis]